MKETILNAFSVNTYRDYYESELGCGLEKMNSSGFCVINCFLPSHPDENASCNISLFNGGWNCFGCNQSGSIFDFHMLRHGSNFKETLQFFCDFLGIKNNKPKNNKSKKKKPLGPPSVVYQYIDLDGKVICETCRYDNPKDFRQRRPHPTKKCEYLWNLKDIEIIPYNLQAVVKSDTLYIVEGEKDADRLTQIGLTATTGPMGAGKWFDSMTSHFKDKAIVILRDNDDPGKQHADLVAHKLHGTAKSIQIVNLPNLKEGEDISDWLNAGNTKSDLLEVIKNQKPYEDHIDFINKKHAVITISGKTQILNEYIDHVFNRHNISFSTVPDLHIKYANRRIPNPNAGSKGQTKEICIITDWLRSIDRREYDDIIFSPGQNVNGCYNLWRGFAFEPKKGDWSFFREHIFKIISNEKQNINDWILTWMSKIIQDPGGKRSKTALVLRGDQGVGKGVYLSNFGRLFGNHYLQINNPCQFTGRFNHHLKDVLFLFVDEGFWAGDKSSEGVIKGIVTEDTLTIEPKGKDIFRLKNHINLAMASNNEWVVPAGLDERRFMVIDVADSMKQNHDYFGAIDKQLKSGGYEAMLYDLLEYDTSKIDCSTIVNTSAGFDQKVQSMTPVQKFWYEKLRSGQLQNNENGWGEIIPRKAFYHQYLSFCDEIRTRYRMSEGPFSKAIKKLCPGISQKYLTVSMDSGGTTKRERHHNFPTLDECRNNFEKKVGLEIEWDSDEVFIDGEFEI